jgi:hypothetical protein
MISRSAYSYLMRLGLVDSSNRPRSRLHSDGLLVHQLPVQRSQLPVSYLRFGEGQPQPDRVATYPWHLDDTTVVSS